MIVIKLTNVEDIVKQRKGWLVAKLSPLFIDIEVEVENIIKNELKTHFDKYGIQAQIYQYNERNVERLPSSKKQRRLIMAFIDGIANRWNQVSHFFKRLTIRETQTSSSQGTQQVPIIQGGAMSSQTKKTMYDFESSYQKAYSQKHPEFERLKKEKLIISLVGSVNAGKSKTVNALTGMNYATSSPIAGWTVEVCLYPLRENIFIADTPGLHDVNEDVSKRAQDFVGKDSDIILFFVNAAVSITRHEKASLMSLKKLDKPLLVVLNKIDALDKDEIAPVLGQIKDETGFDAIPISAKKGTNIDTLSDEISQLLSGKGKDILFGKISVYKEKQVAKWIHGATVSAGLLGIIPIPGVDVLSLSSLQIGLAMKIAYIWGCDVTKDDVMKLVGATITSGVGKELSTILTTYLKAVGWIPGVQLLAAIGAVVAAITASCITYAFGWACNAYYKSGMTLDLGDVETIFRDRYRLYRESEEVKQKIDKQAQTQEHIPTV